MVERSSMIEHINDKDTKNCCRAHIPTCFEKYFRHLSGEVKRREAREEESATKPSVPPPPD